MGNWLGRRLSFWKQALWRPVVWVTSGVFGILWILEFFRDEFFSPAIQERFRLLNLVAHWQWRTWLLAFLGVLLVSLLEGSYRVIESSKARVVEKMDGLRNETATAAVAIADLQARLDAKAPKILVDLEETREYEGAPVPVTGFRLQNVGEIPAVNAQIEEIRNGNCLARFDIATQVLNGSPVTRIATIEFGGFVYPAFKRDLNQLFKAGRPTDVKIQTKQFPLRITYGSLERGRLFETVYELTYVYNTGELRLKFVRYGPVP